MMGILPVDCAGPDLAAGPSVAALAACAAGVFPVKAKIGIFPVPAWDDGGADRPLSPLRGSCDSGISPGVAGRFPDVEIGPLLFGGRCGSGIFPVKGEIGRPVGSSATGPGVAGI